MIEEVKVIPLPDDATGKLRLISALEDLLAEARDGRLLGLSWVGERINREIIWGKSQLAIHDAIAYHTRAIYHLQLSWDESSRDNPVKST